MNADGGMVARMILGGFMLVRLKSLLVTGQR
jgi:hypothetical protein